MLTNIDKVDVCCGLAWGDEAKGKIVAQLAKSKKYNFVCRWSGGHNAGHTVYVNGVKYKTHLIPCGIFYGIPSIIGPDCVVNVNKFLEEIKYLEKHGFNTNLIKISQDAHIVTDNHIKDDKKLYSDQGTTFNGIAPCYRDKYARTGIQVKNEPALIRYIWNDILYGNILCEGAQGFWLDINKGNYPYVTSSNTLPYSACSLGFPPQYINTIYGAAKIYDTRVGYDSDFPEELFEDSHLSLIGKTGSEIGVTTGRKRKVNWLNLDKLIDAIIISGTTVLIISKTDILEKVELYNYIYQSNLHHFNSSDDMQKSIKDLVLSKCNLLKKVIFSDDVEIVNDL